MKNVGRVLLGVVCALILLPKPAEAIPAFQAQFYAKYLKDNKDAAFVKAVKAVKCNLCHAGTKKTDRNPYGDELAKLLDKKTDKDDAKKIKEALQTVAGIKSKADDKESPTFGELIKEGKLPGAK